MNKPAGSMPFLSLGNHLKALRQKMQESLAEVSGAVEIDVNVLKLYEHGAQRPSEDVLMLLISHFGMSDDEAANLWQLAGYDKPSSERDSSTDDSGSRSIMVMMALDSRVLYCNGTNISADKNGVVFSFLQNGTEINGQRVPVSRIGMSYVQAKNFLDVLNQTLTNVDQFTPRKLLPEPKSTKNKQKPEDNR